MAQVKAFSLGGLGAPCCCSPTPTPTPTPTSTCGLGPGCDVPLTLFWTDANGTFTLLNTGGDLWYGCESITLPLVQLTGTSPACICGSTTGTVFVALRFACNQLDGDYTARADWIGVCCGSIGGVGICTPGPFAYSDLSPSGFIDSVCSGPSIVCSFSGSPANPFLNEDSVTAFASRCTPFSWSGTLTGVNQIASPGPISGIVVTS